MGTQPIPGHEAGKIREGDKGKVANHGRFPILEQHGAAAARFEGGTLSGISGDEMPRKSKPVVILGVDSLSVAERVLLFCVASDTNPIEAGVSSATQVMILHCCPAIMGIA